MHKRLSYADAVTVLGGTGPGWELLDRVLGGVLLTATGGGSAVALSLFDAKNEFTRFGRSVMSSLRDRVHGLGRFDRTERLYAAHTVLAVTAFFDALDACDPPFDPRSVSLHRGEQLAIAGAPGGAGWLDQLSMVPAPTPGRSADELAADLRVWYAHLANRLAEHLTGLAVWDALTEGGRMRLRALLQDVLPALALRRYEEMRLRLMADSPEYALWSGDLGDRAVHDRLRSVGQGLTVLESLLREVTTGRRPGDRCAALSAAYRAGLDQPIVAGGAGEIVCPAPR